MPSQSYGTSKVVRAFGAFRVQGRCNTLTHTSYKGGSYCVPTHETAQGAIFNALEEDLRDGVAYYMNEMASSVFRMYFDLDFMVTDRLTRMQLDRFAKVVHNTVSRFFPSQRSVATPNFFEQIYTQSESKQRCFLRSDLKTLTTLEPAVKDLSIVTVRGGCIVLENVAYDVQWSSDDKAPNNSYHATLVATASEDASGAASEDASGAASEDASGAASEDASGAASEDASEDTSEAVDDTGFVRLSNGTKSWFFRNLRMYSAELKRMRRIGPIPDGALNIKDELAAFGATSYTSSTVFALGDGSYFVNAERNDTGLLKHGMHIILPEVYTTIEQALFMREALIEALNLEYGSSNAEIAPNGWYDVVDNAVYGVKKGLRMYGSHKAEQCKECRGQSKQAESCPGRCDRGKIGTGRPHLLHSVYVNGEEDEIREQKYRSGSQQNILKRTSIRSCKTEPDSTWRRYDGCPGYGDMLKTTLSKSGEPLHVLKSKQAIFKTDVKRVFGSTIVVHDSDIQNMFETIIRTRFSPSLPFSKLRVTNIKVTESGTLYFISVAGEGQHYCVNKMPPGDHTNNTIYFQCDRFGICVRCRSPKLTTVKRARGMCKDFCSKSKPLAKREIDKLFPTAKRQRSA
jgi:hypothetical protein